MSAETHYCLFDTALGPFAIAWNSRGIAGVQFAEAALEETRSRLLRRFPDAREAPPTPIIRDAIHYIAGVLRGDAPLTCSVPLDLRNIPPFHRRVYTVAQGIPSGSTRSYGELARAAGSPRAARAVGQAMANNPFVILVPCHRVLGHSGKLGGFSAPGGLATKERLLAVEKSLAGSGGGRFSFDVDLAVSHLRAADPILDRLIAAVGPFRMEVEPISETFMALAEAIVYQQLSVNAARAIFGKFSTLVQQLEGVSSPAKIAALSDDQLRAVGLSRRKSLAIRDLARRCCEGSVPNPTTLAKLDNPEIIDRLTQVRGVGRWTVEMLLMFKLGRPDVLPIDDYGIRKGFAAAYGHAAFPTPKEVADYGLRWQPYRTVASWYLWRAAEGVGATSGAATAM